MDRLQWFLDRIGKRVYRNHHYCCEHCEEVYNNGIVIHDANHANYLCDVEAEFTAGGEPTQYFDTREEVLLWEIKLPTKLNNPDSKDSESARRV